MFQNNKTGFGQSSANTTFGGGFGAAGASTPFGQSTFGKPATSSFPTPAFGSGGTTLFGTSAPAAGGLFGGASAAPAFGQAQNAQPSGFGFQPTSSTGGLFGNQQNTNTGLFSTNSNASAAFGAPKPAFGGFNTNQASTGLFGQQNQQPQATTSLFGQAPTQTNTGLFGSSGFGGQSSAGISSGTMLKFTPVNGSDTMVKNGTTQTISTRHHCITCMKDYEHKSLEELRFEDYAANRKGPQQGAQPGGGLFGATAQPSLFGTPSTSTNTAGGLFGANTSMGAFGAQTSGVFGQTNQQGGGGLFGKPTGFGTAVTTSAQNTGFSFNTPATSNPFQTTANKPFGVAAPQPNTLFGAATSQPSTGFGAQSTGFSTFAPQPNQGMGLFGQNKPAFNSLATTSAGFSFGAPTQPTITNSLFGAKPATAAPNFGGGGFGNTTTPGFGNTGSMFGQAQPTAAGNTSLFGQPFKPAPSFSFGQPTGATNTGLGGNLGLGGQGLFGNTAAKPASSLFGTNTGSMFNNPVPFGSTGNTFGNSNFSMGLGQNQALGLGIGGMSQGGQNTLNQSHQQILAMAAVPYGTSALFRDLLPASGRADDLLKPTNPAAQKAMLQANQFKVSPRSNQRLRTKPVPASALNKKSMFEGMDSTDDVELRSFTPRSNARRLMLKPTNPDQPSQPQTTNAPTNNESFSSPGPSSPHADQSSLNNSWLHEPPVMRERRNEALRKLFMDAARTGSPPAASTQSPPAPAQQDKSPAHEETHAETDNSASSLDFGLDVTGAEGAPPHPAGIRLRRAGYYTIPPLTELAAITAEDGSCVPENFTIGREGYGNVFFAEAFDVSNLDLDSIVHFRHREITLYPDELGKPEVGNGLNRRAQVTLDKVWPIDKTTRQPITDSDRLHQMDYENKLKQACAKLKARFLEYRPQTGSWVFRVEHFSKYGLDESDEEEEPIPSDIKKLKLKPKPLAEPLKPALPSMMQLNGDERIHSQDMLRLRDGPQPMDVHHDMLRLRDATYDEEDAMMDLPYLEKEPMQSQDHYSRHSIASHKVQLMKASFFGDEEMDSDDSDIESMHHGMKRGSDDSHYLDERALLKSFQVPHNQFGSPQIDKRTSVLRISSAKPASRTAQLRSAIQEVEVAPLLVKPVVEVLKYKSDEIPPTSLSLLWKYTQLDKVNRPFDIALIKGGYKAKWGPGNTLLTLVTKKAAEATPINGDYSDLGSFVSGRPIGDCSSNFVQRLQLTSGFSVDADLFKESVLPHLVAQLRHSQVGEEDGCPAVSPASGRALLHAHCAVAQQLADNCVRGGHIHVALEAWKLAAALWGDLDDLMGWDSVSSHQEAMARKAAVSNWLQEAVSPLVEAELANVSQLEQILSLLSANRVSAACKLAMASGEYYAALLLAQLSSTTAVMQKVQQQLLSWQDTETDKLIEPSRLKIYMMAARLPLLRSAHGTINVCEGLDWKRAFALHFWYLGSPVSTVTDALLRYEHAFDQSDDSKGYAAAPKPAHSLDGSVLDLCFHLLKLHSTKSHPLERLLNPATYSADPFDYRLSWLLQQTLLAIGYSHAAAHSTAVVHVNFASQLESHGLWHWAVFVLLHLADVNRRRACVLDVIGRCVRLTEDEEYLAQETFLIEQLMVPQQWISMAKAVLATSLSRHQLTAEYLIEAEEWNRSHAVIMEHIAADAINNERYDQLSELLTALSPAERCASIAGWTFAGSVLVDFLAVMSEVNALLTDRDLASNYQMEKLLPQLGSLCFRINKMECPTPKHTMAQAHIAKVTASLVQACGTLQRGDTWHQLAQLVTKLPSPEDGAHEELAAISRTHPFL